MVDTGPPVELVEAGRIRHETAKAATAAAFGRVHCQICLFEQALGRRVGDLGCGNGQPDTGTDGERDTVDDERRDEGLQHPIRSRQGILDAPFDQGRELVTSEPGYGVGAPHAPGEPFGNADQQLVLRDGRGCR